MLQQSGLSSGVQWLMQASAESCWLVLAIKKHTEPTFITSGSMSLAQMKQTTVTQVILATLDRKRGSVLTMPTTDTPLKRKKALDSALPACVETSDRSFDERVQDPLQSRAP